MRLIYTLLGVLLSTLHVPGVTGPAFLAAVVDNSQGNSEVVDGYQVDSHDVIRCTKKGSTLVFLPSATGRVVWDCWVGRRSRSRISEKTR